MNKIRLLYALESAGGGTLKHVVYLATMLDKDKFDITVVLPDEHYENDTQKSVLLLKHHKVQIDVIPMVKRFSMFSDIHALHKIYSYLKSRRFDIVHAHSSKAGALFRPVARWIHVPIVIYTPHCFHFTAHSGIKKWFYAKIERMLAKITGHIVISETEQTVLCRERIIPRERFSVINNAIHPDDYERLNPEKIKASLKIPANHKVVIGVGRLVKQKNWEMFLKAATLVLKRQSAVTFVIAGDGPLYRHLSEMTEELGISANVRLYGHVDDVSRIYSIADIFVSTSSWDGLPYTYLEALHFNLPMLIASTEGMEYFFRHTRAIPIPIDDCNRLCEKILELLSETLAMDRKNLSFPYSIERFIEQHQELYLRLLEKQRH
jgi:glycosyltransferase involved in cell wall biosynthesis